VTTSEIDPNDVHQVRRVTGLLAQFNRGGVLAAADVHVAQRLQRLGDERDERVLLAAALVVRAVRQGSVCLELAEASTTTSVDGASPGDIARLPWPEPGGWLSAVQASGLVAVGTAGPVDRPLRLVSGLLYLDRYWRQERVIAKYVDEAVARPVLSPDPTSMRSALARLFPGTAPDRQRLAAVVAAYRRVSIVAGGPGTGKTTTVAKLLALLQDQAEGTLRIALAAPTGKAAARLQEAANQAAGSLGPEDRGRLGTMTASTLHRLLGYRPGFRSRFRHDSDNRLAYDVVVVDEASMVSLTLMSRLVEALRPSCRLILVGDPDQLASVEVGAVLGDLVQRPAPPGAPPLAELDAFVPQDLDDLDADEREAALSRGVVRLTHVYRFSGDIQVLADAIRRGDAATVTTTLEQGSAAIDFVEADVAETMAGLDQLRADVVSAGVSVMAAARHGQPEQALAALDVHRLMCAHREGPYGVARWSRQVEEWLDDVIEGYARDGYWYRGRPLLVTTNDHQLRLYNGDTGVVVDVEGRAQAAFRREGAVSLLATNRLSDVQTMHALSVHRSQGSQFTTVTVVLPPAESPLLTRELLYTAVTRAEGRVRIVATMPAVVAAVRRPIARASGLGRREP
jgi:exodeoxyribonuclease V alpha subunit